MQMLKRSRTGLFWQISIEITQALRKFFLFLPFSYYRSFAYYYSCIFFLNKQKECHGFHPEIDSKIKFTYSEKATKTRKISQLFLNLLSKRQMNLGVFFQIFVVSSEYMNFSDLYYEKNWLFLSIIVASKSECILGIVPLFQVNCY